ncbi:MAG: molybdopterin cofactor-binding domain-containing protein [Nocardioidaceae bacterium]
MTTTRSVSTRATLPRDLTANPRLSRWFTVTGDGDIGLRVGKVELGQGILTALAQVAAEELDVPMGQIRALPAHTDLGPDEGLTAGSMSIMHAAPAVRVAAANVRALFVAAAARRWGVEPADVTVADGWISAPGRERLSYGELAGAVDLDVDASAPTKRPGSIRLVGTSAPRTDLPDKVTGRACYLADLRWPGMLFGRAVRPPSPGARIVEVTDEPSGVQVVRDGSFLGVVGPAEPAVTRAADALRAGTVWAEDDLLPDEADLDTFLRRGPHEDTVIRDETADGSPTARRLAAHYSRPFLAHASIGTSCAAARWEPDGRLQVWSHSQGIHRLRDAVADVLAIDPTSVTIEHVQHAGCYGHNAADDAAFDAVLLARAVPGTHVLVQWSRSDELGWAPFGPAMTTDVAATVSESGRITGWDYDIYSQGHTSRPGYAGAPGLLAGAYLERPLPVPAPIDPPLDRGGGATRNSIPIYAVGPRRITGHRLTRTPIRSSSLRALGAFMNVFSIESFMDELAASRGEDPLAYRLRHLDDERARAVLETAAAQAGWGDERPGETARGIGLARYKDHGAYCAVVADVEAGDRIRVRALTIAVDVGQVINPDGVRNQIEGGATQATSWTLKERVRFDRRRITSTDWETYPVLRFSEAPLVDVHLVDRPELPPLGAGEAAQGPTVAAIGNAVAATVGVRVRDLPITNEAVVAAIDAQPG